MLFYVLVLAVILGAIAVVIIVNFMLAEFELLLQTTPLCGSFVQDVLKTTLRGMERTTPTASRSNCLVFQAVTLAHPQTHSTSTSLAALGGA